jgi:hypothetical protein
MHADAQQQGCPAQEAAAVRRHWCSDAGEQRAHRTAPTHTPAYCRPRCRVPCWNYLRRSTVPCWPRARCRQRVRRMPDRNRQPHAWRRMLPMHRLPSPQHRAHRLWWVLAAHGLHAWHLFCMLSGSRGTAPCGACGIQAAEAAAVPAVSARPHAGPPPFPHLRNLHAWGCLRLRCSVPCWRFVLSATMPTWQGARWQRAVRRLPGWHRQPHAWRHVQHHVHRP